MIDDHPGIRQENPYAVVADGLEEAPSLDSSRSLSASSVFRTYLLWAVVCCVSATPSFVIASTTMAKDQFVAMVIGVMVFIQIYAGFDLWTRPTAFRRNPRVRSILRATFIVRAFMVVLFPVAVFTDVFLGAFSVSLVSWLFGTVENAPPLHSSMGFGMTLVTTLLQGCLLSLLLIVLGLIITLIVFVTRSLVNRS